MRRILSFLLALCMIVGLLPAVAIPHAHAATSTGTVDLMKNSDYELTLTASSDGKTVAYTKNKEVTLKDKNGNAFTGWVQEIVEVTDEATDEWNMKFYGTGTNSYHLILKGAKIDFYNDSKNLVAVKLDENGNPLSDEVADPDADTDTTDEYYTCSYAFGCSDSTKTTQNYTNMYVEVVEDSYLAAVNGICNVVGGAYRWGHTHITGTNDALLTIKSSSAGINVQRNLTIDANLDITARNTYGGIYVNSTTSSDVLTINGGDITVKMSRTSGDVGSAIRWATSTNDGFYLNGGNLTLQAASGRSAFYSNTSTYPITVAEGLCYQFTDADGNVLDKTELSAGHKTAPVVSKVIFTSYPDHTAGTWAEGKTNCTVCGVEMACEHEYAETVTKAPTCTETGEGVKTCTVCGISQATIVEALGHTPKAVKENETDTTYEKIVNCDVCGIELSRETVEKMSAEVTLWGTEVAIDTDIDTADIPEALYWVNNGTDYPKAATAEDDWNFAFTFVDGRPTVSLKNAAFKKDVRFLYAGNVNELELKYEGTNDFLYVNTTAFMEVVAATANKGHLYITGAENAVLNVKGNGYKTTTISIGNKLGGLTISGGTFNLQKKQLSSHPVISVAYVPTVIENCAITVQTAGATGNNVAALAFGGQGGDLEIIDSDITITTVDAMGILAGVYLSSGKGVEYLADMYIKGDSNIVVNVTTAETTLTGTYKDAKWMGSGLVANNIHIKGGTLEITASNRAVGTYIADAPDLADYVGYYNMYTAKDGDAVSAYAETPYLRIETADEATHTHVYKTVKENEVKATCTVDGSYEEVVLCEQCGVENSRQTVIVTATGHDYVDGVCSVCGESEILACDHSNTTTTEVVNKDATCTEAGSKTVTVICECGEVISETVVEITALGHTEEVIPGKAATCTATGLTDGKKCSVCGEITVAQETIEATDHNYVDGVCSGCGDKITSGYMLYILNGDGTVGMTIKGSKTTEEVICLKSALEDARVFAENGLIFGITGTPSFIVELYEDTYEDESFTLGADVTVKGNGHNIVLADGVTLDASAATMDDVTVVLPKVYVAEVGGVQYETLEEAFAAATEGATITLLADATPALTSQRAITKAAVIDLGGKTLTLTEDDLYFGTTTFKNGTIVVDPSVKPSTAVFWMFANQTLTFDAVKLVATGVTGTYLIGLDGNNSDLNLINGSEILVENTTALDLDIICVNASTGNDIKVENSKVNVTNLDGRVFFRGNYTICGNSDIDLSGITKAGFRIEAGQTLTIADTATVDIVGEPRDGGIHLTDVTATYTKADTATVNATVTKPITYVAQVGEQKFETLAEAVAVGGEVTLLTDVTLDETITVAAGQNVVLNLQSYTITGKPATAAAYSVINNKGTLTVIGTGAIVCDHQLAGSTAYAVNTITNGGTLIIDGATIENKSTATNQIGYAIDNNSTTGDAIVQIKSGEIKVSGSSYYYDGIRLFCNSITKENSVTVTGGTVSSIWLQNPSDGAADRNTKDVKGSVTIEGGKVNALYLEPSSAFAAAITNGEIGSVSAFESAEGRDLTGFISGGTFSAAVPEEFCAEGYIPTANADGTYGVKVGEYVAEVNGVKYETLQEAENAAADGDTIVLLTDITLDTKVTFFNSASARMLTLDMNGKTITLNDNWDGDNNPCAIWVCDGLTIIGNGTINANPANGWAYAIIVGHRNDSYAGNLVIENGTFYSNDSSVVSVTHGSVAINGGTFESAGKDLSINCIDDMYDAGKATIAVYGGEFVGFDPANNAAEGAGTNFLGDKTKHTKCIENVYSICKGTHNAVVTAPDCLNGGYTTYTCAECGDSYVADEVAALGHTWNAGVITVKPTGTTEGVKTFTCENDPSHTKTETMPVLPEAIVNKLGAITYTGDYLVYDLVGGKGLSNGTNGGFNMQVAMQFIAKDTPEQAAESYYADYTTDFYIKIDGLTDGDATGCYLAGYYETFGGWVLIPLDGMIIEDGMVYPVITSVGFDFSYEMICSQVKDFTCGICFSDEFLAKNPNVEVSLSMGLSETYDQALAADFVAVEEHVYDEEALNVAPVASVNGIKFYSLAEAIAYAQDAEVKLLADVVLEETLTIAADKTIVLDLNGKTVSMADASGKTAALLINKGTLTIVDFVGGGKLTFNTTTPSAANAYASNTITNHGTLTIEGGIIENTSVGGGACYALDNYAGSIATINGGKLTAAKTTVRIFNWTNGEAAKATLTINGGEIFSEDGYGVNLNLGNTPVVELAINGGTITTNDTDYNLGVYIVNKGSAENLTVKVTDGTINGSFALNGVTCTTMVKDAVSISGGTMDGVICYGTPAYGFISGGTFSAAVDKELCVEGYLPEANEDGTYTVVLHVHTEEMIPAVDATCGATGLTAGTKCSVCGEILVEQEEIPATGDHVFDNDGDATCNNCGYTRFVEITLLLDENNKLFFVDPNANHIYHRVTVYYLGDKTVDDITLINPLKDIDPNAKTYWGADVINSVELLKEGNYVVHLNYNTKGSPKYTIAKQFTVTAETAAVPTIELENNKLVVTDENTNNIYHRATVYYLGSETVSNIYDVDALKAIDAEAKTTWGLEKINEVLLTKSGNYVVHLHYNNPGSDKITVAEEFTVVASKPAISRDGYTLKVTDKDQTHKYHRATVYFVDNATVDIYNEAELKAIDPNAKTYWGLQTINKVQMAAPGSYVIYLSYNLANGVKQTMVVKTTIRLPEPSVWLEENGQIGTIVPVEVVHRNYVIYYLGDQTVEDIRDIDALNAIDPDPIKFDNQKQIAERGVLTEKGNYVLVMYYNYSGSARQYIAEFATLK